MAAAYCAFFQCRCIELGTVSMSTFRSDIAESSSSSEDDD
eukprot:CAMPEP_0196224614 /NCGR_PEP_ID=MMETSP0912-20130531/49141_1 /TAXON_ID=49265 /ORGANISM="Thalassiosira rotula, Strain GSO102" /LENGTH=39 /DNA_ID= /DNA_START= /DNA_END= /DNA_ORIENTATION=